MTHQELSKQFIVAGNQLWRKNKKGFIKRVLYAVLNDDYEMRYGDVVYNYVDVLYQVGHQVTLQAGETVTFIDPDRLRVHEFDNLEVKQCSLFS